MKKINKKAVSLMVSYVILISIAIVISVGTYSWIKYYPEMIRPAVDCKEGTSVILEEYNCDANVLELSLKNNGLFSIDGIIVHSESDAKKEPTEILEISEGGEGAWPLKPRESETPEEIVNINYDMKDNIAVLKIQPFIIDENGKQIVCMQSIIIDDEIVDCVYS